MTTKLRFTLGLFANFFLLQTANLFSQSIERSVISSFGFSYSGVTMQNTCTVGEVITFTGQSATLITTNGFQQPSIEDDLCIGAYIETINAKACSNYLWNEQTYTESGTYILELLTAEGCDSIITLNLTINALNNQVVANGDTLVAMQDNASYSWIDCATQQIVGTEQSFLPSVNGLYQVQISQEGCDAISECTEVIIDGISENTLSSELKIYPNPANEVLTLNWQNKTTNENVIISIIDTNGKLVWYSRSSPFNQKQIDISHLSGGVYSISLEGKQTHSTARFIVTK